MAHETCRRCGLISGPIVAGGFFLLGLLSFSIAAGVYGSSKQEEFTYESPSGLIIAFHWLCMIAGIALGVGLFLLSKSMVIGVLVSGIGGGVLVIFWILYMVFFFIGDEFKMTANAISLEQLRGMWAEGQKKCPYVSVKGTGYYVDTSYSNGRRKSTRKTCWTDEGQIPTSDSCDDATVLQDVTESQMKKAKGFRVYTDVSYTLDDDDQMKLNLAKGDILQCFEDKHKYLREPEIVIGGGIQGVGKDVFVTLDGKSPWYIDKGKGIAAGIFFCGVVYAYQVCMMPILRQTMVKKNVSLTDAPIDANAICSQMGNCDYY